MQFQHPIRTQNEQGVFKKFLESLTVPSRKLKVNSTFFTVKKLEKHFGEINVFSEKSRAVQK